MRPKSRVKNILAVSLLLGCSVFVSLALGEVLIRQLLDPADYLQVSLVDDKVVGHKVSPNTSGYDKWGFRNRLVPDRAKIVAIGDSQTYGVSAAATDSWPAQLDRLIDGGVYNLSLGGYGPAQYYHLLKTKAFDLNPSVVIIGFYFGNDLADAYNVVYKLDYWKEFRRPGFVASQEVREAEAAHVAGDRAPRFLGGIRSWLARHSVTYRLFTFSFGNFYRFLEMKYFSSRTVDEITVLDIRDAAVRTGFRPSVRWRVLDLEEGNVREGLRLSLELIHRMKTLCAGQGVDLLVALIPTKESVYAEYIENNDKIHNSKIIDQLIAGEARINQSVKNYFDQHKIRYVDLLPELRRALPARTIYPQNEDGHPNAEGYNIIATAIHRALAEIDL